MEFDIFAMMKEEQKKAPEKEIEEEVEQPQKDEKVAEDKENNTKKKVSKKVEKKKDDKPKKKSSSSSTKEVYEYPFSLYTEGHTVDISCYGFEDGKKYTSKEINDIMLRHRHYEFAGEMTYQMFEEDNMLVATAKQYKKG